MYIYCPYRVSSMSPSPEPLRFKHANNANGIIYRCWQVSNHYRSKSSVIIIIIIIIIIIMLLSFI